MRWRRPSWTFCWSAIERSAELWTAPATTRPKPLNSKRTPKLVPHIRHRQEPPVQTLGTSSSQGSSCRMCGSGLASFGDVVPRQPRRVPAALSQNLPSPLPNTSPSLLFRFPGACSHICAPTFFYQPPPSANKFFRQTARHTGRGARM